MFKYENDSDSNPVGSPSASEAGSLVMDVDESDKRFHHSSGGDPDGSMSDSEGPEIGPEIPGRSYTVTSLPASEHAELASAVLNSSGPKINCPVSEPDVDPLSGHCDWPADHTAIC